MFSCHSILHYNILYYITDRHICVHHYSKRKRTNLFKYIGRSDERTNLDFIFGKDIGKSVSRSTKTMRDGSDIHPSFYFDFEFKV